MSLKTHYSTRRIYFHMFGNGFVGPPFCSWGSGLDAAFWGKWETVLRFRAGMTLRNVELLLVLADRGGTALGNR